MIEINIKKAHPKAIIPKYFSEGASCIDLYAVIDEPLLLPSMKIALITTGLIFEIPLGFEGQIRTRSGMALSGIVVLNSPGTIDSDYRGVVQVVLMNLSKDEKVITPLTRIAQMAIVPVVKANFVLVNQVTETDRGDGGFGSTGF